MNGRRSHARSLVWLIPVGLAVPLAFWGLRHPTTGSGTAATSGPSGGSGPASGGPGSADVESRRIAVEKTVAQRNAEAHRDEAAFVRAGWKMVATDPPDPKLIALDPSLLHGHERELRVQVASTLASPAMAPNLGRIAAEAQEPQTRVDAVEALGRLGGAEAQQQLLQLLDKLSPEDDARKALVPLLRPAALDDAETPQLAALLDAPALTAAEKQQIAFTLALVGLRDGMKLPATVSLSPDARKLIDSMTLLAQRGSAAAQGGAP